MILPAEVQELIDTLRAEVAVLRSECVGLRRDNEALRLENAALKAENAELRRRLDLDSSTSSKPPSSDGLKKKPRIPGSLRGRSGKKSGGQAGHKGETLRQAAAPDRIVRHEAEVCRHCRAGLAASMQTGVDTRQVFDLPERLIEVTEHQAAIYACGHCRRETRAQFPAGVVAPAQYGPRIRAAAIYLNVQQLVPEDRVAQIFADLFGARLCPASAAGWARVKARALTPVLERIAALARIAPVRCLDETGFRVEGKLHWLHTISTDALTLYRVSQKRGETPSKLKGGVVVHDHFHPYYALRDVAHAFCNAHHLRELKGLIELDKEAWAAPMRDLLVEAAKAVRRARDAGAHALPPAEIESFRLRYRERLRAGFAFHRGLPRLKPDAKRCGRPKRRPGHNLLIRLHRYKDAVLRFLVDFSVPFTNNLAEQDLRMMKVRQKISGGFRTLQGARDFACLRSIVSTARKQGRNILQTLSATPATTLNA
jgi:transposase